VIPAPTLEVKRTFSGYLVDPLRLRYFTKRGRPRRVESVEKSLVRPTYSSFGKFYIADTVITAIAARAASEVDGVHRPGRVSMEQRTDGISLEVEIAVRYGRFIPGILAGVRRKVRAVVEECTALNVLNVDVVARRVALEG